MKTVELSDETHPARFPLDVDGLSRLLADPDFLTPADPGERYLKLLAWCALNHPSDFADFISHQESGRGYLILTPNEVQEVRNRNQARQIDGTQFWAVTAIATSTKLRFVRRLLEFIGCDDRSVGDAVSALGFAATERSPQRSGTA